MPTLKANSIKFSEILRQELQVATGCTEPIALAYCAASAVKILGCRPERYTVLCSGNIVKNVKSVTVPNTGGLRGIKAAVLAGAIGGDASAGLDVLGSMTDEQRAEVAAAMDIDNVEVKLLDTTHVLHMVVKVFSGEHSAVVEIADTHTGIIRAEKDGEPLEYISEYAPSQDDDELTGMTLESIFEYAENLNSEEIFGLLDRQLKYNEEIARVGMDSSYGESVGRTLLETSDGVYNRMQAMAAAGSDARMGGCPMPVVVNCGSGNQGITSSVPLAEYASFKNASRDKLLRAVCISDLVALRQKSVIGRLSAYCGAVAAAAGCTAGMAYLDDLGPDVAGDAIVNTIATIGGMVCDGAKASCASKIAVAINCAQLGYEMAKKERTFRSGDGIVKDDIEATIDSVGRMAAKGMASTDTEILRIMLDQ